MAEPGGGPALGGWKSGLVGGLIGALVGAGAVAFSSPWLIRSYLLDHPEIRPEAMERLRSREMASAVGQNRAAFETPFHGAWAGAADGDVVLVEFFDYACGFCLASNPDVERLLREDPRLKVVWRDYPVLGPDSEQAAILSLAAARAGRFRAFHDRLFATARPTATARSAAAEAAGLEPASLTEEYRSELEKNFALARAIGADGTPTFVVGDQVLQGAVGYEALRQAIAEARAR
jgi:protein-disulfide isomerase